MHDLCEYSKQYVVLQIVLRLRVSFWNKNDRFVYWQIQGIYWPGYSGPLLDLREGKGMSNPTSVTDALSPVVTSLLLRRRWYHVPWHSFRKEDQQICERDPRDRNEIENQLERRMDGDYRTP